MGASIDPESLELGLAMLPDDLRLAFAEALEPPWKARARRLEMRDHAIREAAGLFTDRAKTATAEAISRALRQHLAGRIGDAPAMFHRIAELNQGRPLSARQVLDILCGSRTVTRQSTMETA